jgi:DNA-directed RNA polymerase III subunit RPC7
LLVQEITLPEMSCAKATTEEKALIQSTMKLEEFFRSSSGVLATT